MKDPGCEWLAAREQQRSTKADTFARKMGVASLIVLTIWGLMLIAEHMDKHARTYFVASEGK